jgi:hypothetical protein
MRLQKDFWTLSLGGTVQKDVLRLFSFFLATARRSGNYRPNNSILA